MKFKILFLYASSSQTKDAYSLRLDKLKQAFYNTNIKADSLYLKDYLFGSPSLLYPLNILFLFKKLREYDLIHAGNTPAAYFMKIYSLFVKDILYIYDVHGDVIQECLLILNKFNVLNYYNLFQSILMEKFASNSTYFLPCSESLKQHYVNYGIDSNRIEVILNGVDIDSFKPLAEIFVRDTHNNNFLVTYAGGFQKWQGIDNLIAAAKLINDPTIEFKIIGFTETNQKLKKRILSKLNCSVQLIDFLPRSTLIKHLSESDVLIIPRNKHPAIEVAFPTKFAEYIALGKPLIVTRVDETTNFVERFDCGFVCEPSPQSIAETIRIAKNTPKEVLLKKGANSRLLAENEFDQNLINEKYFNFISKLLEDNLKS